MPAYAITHNTTYRYVQPASLSHHAMRLEPMGAESQECLHFALNVRPAPAETGARTDYFGNRTHYCIVTEPHRELAIEATSRVTVTPAPASLLAGSAACGELRAWLEGSADAAAHQARQFLYPSPLAPHLPEVAEFARRFFPENRPVLEGARELCGAIHRQFQFDPTATTPATPLGEFFQMGRGVCQDFAHLAVASLRAAGLPARYVSGYLLTEPPPGQPRMIGADASHAWAGVYVPEAGWVDFDPTNDCLCGERHITLARGRDYGDVSPVSGTVAGGGAHTLYLGVTVAPAGE